MGCDRTSFRVRAVVGATDFERCFIGMDCIRTLRRWMNVAMTTKASALRGRVSEYGGEGTLRGTALRNETQAQADRQAAGADQTKYSGPRYAAREIISLFVYTPT